MHPEYCYDMKFPFAIQQEVITDSNIKQLTDNRYRSTSPVKGSRVVKPDPVVFEKNNPELYALLHSFNLKVDGPYYFIKNILSHSDNLHADIGDPVRNTDHQRRVGINLILKDVKSSMRWYVPKPERINEAKEILKVGLQHLNIDLFNVDHEEITEHRKLFLARTDKPHSNESFGERHCLSIGLLYNEEARNELTWADAKKLFAPYFC